jgi:hypothetical protein
VVKETGFSTIVSPCYQNTLDILNGCSKTAAAVFICINLELKGYSDWVFPSIDELNRKYLNLNINNIRNFKGIIMILLNKKDVIY